MTSKRIKQGNLGPVWRVGVQTFDASGVAISGSFEDLSANYTCTVAVATAIPPIERTVTRLSSDNTRYLVQLTGAETATMSVGNHTIAIEVENTTVVPPFRIEEHVELIIEEEHIVA